MACGCKEKHKRRGTIQFLTKSRQPLKASSSVRDMRLRVCEMCKEHVLDARGEPTLEMLYGRYEGSYYCGDPNEPRTDQDEMRFGCGCKISDRTIWETAACPRGRWGPGRRIATNIVAYYTKADGDLEPNLYDFIGPARCGRDGMIDCTGIGDNMIQGVAAQAIWRQKRSEGVRVRFVAVSHRMAWAELATAGKMEIVDFGNPSRSRAMYSAHSAPIKAVEIDATCRLRGLCRQELIAMEHHTPPAATREWAVKIPHTAMMNAAEFLSHPIRERRPIIALSPWTNAAVRQWPIRHWGQLSELLRAQGFAVCILDAPKAKGRAVPSDAFPSPKFRSADPYEVAAAVSKVDMVIGNDSGMPHLAGFVGTRALAICGPTDGRVAFGGWPSVTPIQAPGECSGCLWFKDGGWNSWCGFGCQMLSELRPSAVLEHVMSALQRKV